MLIGCLAIIIILAWIWLIFGAGMDMTAIEMTRMAGMDGWMMQPAAWTLGYALLVLSMWWVMMVAMMLPSAAPMMLLFARINSKAATGGRSLVPTSIFVGGYLLVWFGFSIVAVALQWALESIRLLSPMLETSPKWLGAGILICAGLWQLTPMKRMCLSYCRTPFGFLTNRWRDGHRGALLMGIEHGAWCLGCCWALMILLFFGGIMNLCWIVGLAIFVLLEKTLPFGNSIGRILGLILVCAGVALAVQGSADV